MREKNPPTICDFFKFMNSLDFAKIKGVVYMFFFPFFFAWKCSSKSQPTISHPGSNSFLPDKSPCSFIISSCLDGLNMLPKPHTIGFENHGSPISKWQDCNGCWSQNGICSGILIQQTVFSMASEVRSFLPSCSHQPIIYHLVIQHSYGKMAIYSELSDQKLYFSMVFCMLTQG